MKRNQSGIAHILIIIAVIVVAVLGFAAYGVSQNKKSETKQTSNQSQCFPEIQASSARQTQDQTDDASDYQVHIIYAVSSEETDRKLDTNGKIATSVSAWQNWLCKQTKGKYLKLDTHKGNLDLTFVRVGKNLPSSELVDELKRSGFNNPQKAYAVYYEGLNSRGCGLGGNKYAARYLQGEGADVVGLHCDLIPLATNPSKADTGDILMLHEILHALGFVPTCAPNSTNQHHVSNNPYDILYQSGELPDAPRPESIGEKTVLDPNHTDYYEANIPNCPDLSRSAFLAGGGDELPVEWR